MIARRQVPVIVCAAVLAVVLGGSASAAERAGCEAPSVQADAGVRAAFPGLVERIRDELGRPDMDRCARVELFVDAPNIRVAVTLADGRAASRSASRAEDVLPTLQALLLVPAAPPAAAVPWGGAPAAAHVRQRVPLRGAPVLARDADRIAPKSEDAEPRALGFELSLVGGPRMGGGQLAVGLGALSLVEIHGWLFGFQSRVDRYQTVLSGDPEMALELALLAGKRVHLRSVALDFNVGPALAMKGLAFSNTETAQVSSDITLPPPAPPEEPGTGAVPRLLISARAGFTPRDLLRSFAGIEASVGPARAEQLPSSDSGQFPIFAVGVVLGGTVGTR